MLPFGKHGLGEPRGLRSPGEVQLADSDARVALGLQQLPEGLLLVPQQREVGDAAVDVGIAAAAKRRPGPGTLWVLAERIVQRVCKDRTRRRRARAEEAG